MLNILKHSDTLHEKISELINNDNCKGVLLIKDVPVNEDSTLLEYCNSLGLPSEATRRYSNKEKKVIHIVESKKNAIFDKKGNILVSSTSKKFDLHTDEYFHLNPAEYMILQCVNPDKSGGGLTILCFLSDILDDISSVLKKELLKQQFPCRGRKVSVLFKEENKIKIRFNRNEILNYINKSKPEEEKHLKRIVSKFEKVVKRNSRQFLLNRGDCLILLNKEVLHGRTSFADDSSRLFKRVRLSKMRKNEIE